jgi:hypothetical protein
VDPYPENVQGEEEPLQECFEPFIGMKLDSVDACYKFYNLYGLIAGFGIRKAQKDALYEIKRIHDPATDAKTWSYCVQVDKANNEVSYNCQGFEF